MSRVVLFLVVVAVVIGVVLVLAGRGGRDRVKPSAPPPAPRALPGWYPDPVTGRERWWDGVAWTDEFRDGPGQVGPTR